MIHGWRPTSVTVQPASIAMKPIGAASASARSSQRCRRTGPSAPDGQHAGPPRDQRHERAQRHHELERDVDRRDVRPVVARESVEPLHLRVRVVEGEKRQAAGDLDRVARGSASTSGHPPITSGAPRWVSKSASIAASFAG